MKNTFKSLLLLGLFLTATPFWAQVNENVTQEVSPKQDLTDLALIYYSIDFTPEQRALIGNQPIELIFKVAEDGAPTLHKINGVTDDGIQSLLEETTQTLPNFNPKMVNGKAESAVFFLNLQYPSYEFTTSAAAFITNTQFHQLKASDFESITLDNTGGDLLIGFVANQFIGNPSRYNGIGPGIKMDYTFNDSKNFLYGINMSVYGNKNKMDYPIHTNVPQMNNRAVVMIGLSFGKWFDKFNIQADLNYAAQNITEKQYEKDPNWVQFRGFSPGVSMHYPILIGKQKPTLYYGLPAVVSHYVNFHGGMRYLALSQKQASGLMFELGISYRMRVRNIESYIIKSKL